MQNRVYINRTLNLKKIKYIGFDMDHTLVRYNGAKFEELSFKIILEKLIETQKYPEGIKNIEFNFHSAIRGLILDTKKGNLLKTNRHGAIRTSYHGINPISFKAQQNIYRSTYIDLRDSAYYSVDTTFSISHAALFAQLINYKDNHPEANLPSYENIDEDIISALDIAHLDGSLKGKVKENIDQFIVIDPLVAERLEFYKIHNKKLFILTNSDFAYTKLLMDYSINPYLKKYKSWMEIFDYVITMAQKPRFFHDNLPFLKVNQENFSMTNYHSKLVPGIYQGGCARLFTQALEVDGDEILYIGDHIYGDILRLKKDCYWRTAMVIEELDNEIQSDARAKTLNEKIEQLMKDKAPFESQYVELTTLKEELGKKVDEKSLSIVQDKIYQIDHKISQLIVEKQKYYNLNWGPLMRVGNEESYFAHQVELFACIYMAKISDFLALSPRSYLRAPRIPLAYEISN